jgi:acyl-CoA reductase-like NAD-dependent aldehyde dehydrogenase
MDSIIKHAIKGRFSNYGQKCNSSKRFIVIESMYDTFCQKFTEAVEQLKVGDPMNEMTDIGPLAKTSAVKDIDAQVKQSIEQ